MKYILTITTICMLILSGYGAVDKKSYEYVFRLEKPYEKSNNNFTDADVSIWFEFTRFEFAITITNRSEDQPITIDWDKISYVDVWGKSHRIVHKGIRYIERDRPQPPTVIPPKAQIEDILVPSDYVEFNSSRYSRSSWERREMFEKPERGAYYHGKTFSIFMPLQIGEQTKNYNFGFRISIVEQVKKK